LEIRKPTLLDDVSGFSVRKASHPPQSNRNIQIMQTNKTDTKLPSLKDDVSFKPVAIGLAGMTQ
jgi:hypothetical protein